MDANNVAERMAKAIAQADPMGPENFDQATRHEQDSYFGMALAAMNNARPYIVHAPDLGSVWGAVAYVEEPMTIQRHRDDWEAWMEDREEGASAHLMIGVDSMAVAEELQERIRMRGVASFITPGDDYGNIL